MLSAFIIGPHQQSRLGKELLANIDKSIIAHDWVEESGQAAELLIGWWYFSLKIPHGGNNVLHCSIISTLDCSSTADQATYTNILHKS